MQSTTYIANDAISKIGNISEHEIWELIRDVSTKLKFLHENYALHGSIKPDNILHYELRGYVLSDNALSKDTLSQTSNQFNSSEVVYKAPELFEDEPFAVMATDVWALGATIYELATGEKPFGGQGGIAILRGTEIPHLPRQFSASLDDLMRRCLSKEPWNRPMSKEINEIAASECDKNPVQSQRQTVRFPSKKESPDRFEEGMTTEVLHYSSPQPHVANRNSGPSVPIGKAWRWYYWLFFPVLYYINRRERKGKSNAWTAIFHPIVLATIIIMLGAILKSDIEYVGLILALILYAAMAICSLLIYWSTKDLAQFYSIKRINLVFIPILTILSYGMTFLMVLVVTNIASLYRLSYKDSNQLRQIMAMNLKPYFKSLLWVTPVLFVASWLFLLFAAAIADS